MRSVPITLLTKKLYYEDPYIKEFKANILRADGLEIVLGETAFYPEGGGQAGDTGIIGETPVLDTIIVDGQIIHLIEFAPSFLEGETVRCRIDWDRRYKIMKLHSAAHIMEHFLWKIFGRIERLGSYVDENKDRADYAYIGRLPTDKLKRVEEATNEFLLNEFDITTSPKPGEPEIRIWRCGPIEMPCGGTHVRNTSEIGIIKIKRKNPGKGTERIETTLA